MTQQAVISKGLAIDRLFSKPGIAVVWMSGIGHGSPWAALLALQSQISE